MKKVTMLTVVPAAVAEELVHSRKVEGYNNLPQINKGVLDAIREYMTDNVGYNNLPMACLKKIGTSSSGSEGSIFTKIPVNSKDSVLFQLEMPDDMIVSVEFSALLNASNSADVCSCDEELAFTQECFKESLHLGIDGGEDEQDQIIFIPFLALDRCKFYAKFDKNFNTEDYNLPGLEKMDIRELSSFIN